MRRRKCCLWHLTHICFIHEQINLNYPFYKSALNGRAPPHPPLLHIWGIKLFVFSDKLETSASADTLERRHVQQSVQPGCSHAGGIGTRAWSCQPLLVGSKRIRPSPLSTEAQQAGKMCGCCWACSEWLLGTSEQG